MGKDLSEEISAAQELSSKLASAAETHSGDIGTADYCCERIGASTTPGKLVTWLLNTDVAGIYKKAEDLWRMKTPLDSVNGVKMTPVAFQKLFEGENGAEQGSAEAGWGGESGDKFQKRYGAFSKHVDGVSNDIEVQASDLYQIGEAFQALQQTCYDGLTDEKQLGDFENQFRKAMEEDNAREMHNDLTGVAKESVKFAGNAAAGLLPGGTKSAAGTAGVDYVVALLSLFGDNVKNTAADSVQPALLKTSESATEGQKESGDFSAIPKSGFEPISASSAGYSGDWKSD